METYYRKRSGKSHHATHPITEMNCQQQEEAAPLTEHGGIDATHGLFLGRQNSVHLAAPLSPHCVLLAEEAQAAGGEAEFQNHIEVGYLYEIAHINLPPRTPRQLNCIRIVMVCEKTNLNTAVRFPGKESLRAFFSYSTRETHPALDEKYVMGTALAARVLQRRILAEEYSEQKHLESFWVLNSSNVDCLKDPSTVIQNNGTSLSDLQCKFMVRWGTRRQVRYLGRHKENGGNSSNPAQNSSSSVVNGVVDDQTELAIEKQKGEVNEDDGNEIDDADGKENVEEMELNEEDNGDKQEDDNAEEVYMSETGKNLKRKGYETRIGNVKKAKKGKLETKRSYKQKKNLAKKKSKNRSKEALILRNPKDRWSSERYKLAENNLLEVMKAKGATAGKPLLRPQLRAKARKMIGDTGLLDHLLKHMAGKLAPGGKERFRRRQNADGAMEYWLESADVVNLRKEAGVTDPYWVPPPGWKPGNSPTQDPICAREIKLLNDDLSTLKRYGVDGKYQDTTGGGSRKTMKLNELLSKNKEEERQALSVSPCHCGISQKLDQLTNSLMTSKLDHDSAPVISVLGKCKEQLMIVSDFVKEMEERIGKQSCYYNVKEKAPTEKAAEKILEARTAEEKAAHIQRLKSGFRSCKPQGTFLWPNSSSINNSSSMLPHQVLVQVELPTPPSVSSSSASAPPQISPYTTAPHHHPASPIKPLAERRAVSVTV